MEIASNARLPRLYLFPSADSIESSVSWSNRHGVRSSTTEGGSKGVVESDILCFMGAPDACNRKWVGEEVCETVDGQFDKWNMPGCVVAIVTTTVDMTLYHTYTPYALLSKNIDQ